MSANLFHLFCVFLVIAHCAANGYIFKSDAYSKLTSEFMHPKFGANFKATPVNQNELSSNYYLNMGKEFVAKQIQNKRNVNRNIAKNVILFLGDGMSITTLAATRMYMGGEEKTLSFEQFANVGMSKTYCVDEQVADSACTSTGENNFNLICTILNGRRRRIKLSESKKWM